VNYELPMVAEDYVHRIGRTGRAGKDGEAISLVCVDERPLLQDIQALLRRPIPTETIGGFEPNRSIRPEPIRLRSTPAERAERLAARGPQSGRGHQPSNRGGQPSQSNRGGQAGQRVNAGHAAHAGARGGQPSAARGSGRATNGRHAPRPTGDAARHGGQSGHNRRSRQDRAATPYAPGTGFGNAAPDNARAMPGERIRRLEPR
jgi:ATP-dependent RNA helicase RhlE